MRDSVPIAANLVRELRWGCSDSMPCTFWATGPATPVPTRAADAADLLAAWVTEVSEQWGPPGRVVLDGDRVLGHVLVAPAGLVPRLSAFATAPSDGGTPMLLTIQTAPAPRRAAPNGDGSPAPNHTANHGQAGSREATTARADALRGRELGGIDANDHALRKYLFQIAARDLTRRGADRVEAIGARPASGSHGCVLPVAILERRGFRIERDHGRNPRLGLDLRTAIRVRQEAQDLLARLVRLGRAPAEAPNPDGATRGT